MDKNQKEFSGMDRTPLGKKAVEYLNLRDELENRQTELDGVKKELVTLFKESGKTSIKVSDFTITVAHMETDTVKVKQQKE